MNKREQWPQDVYEGLQECCIGGRTVTIYKDMPDTLYHALKLTAEKYPDKTALVEEDVKSLTYKEFLDAVDRLAADLSIREGVRHGDTVGLLIANRLEFAIGYLALVKLGAVFVSLPGKFQKPELESLIEKAEVKLIIAEQKYYDWFHDREDLKVLLCGPVTDSYGFSGLLEGLPEDADVPAAGKPEDPVILMFTSGTTSQSKGVLLRNYNVMQSVDAYCRTLHLSSEDRTLLATPMYHITGLVCILSVFLRVGATIYIQHKVDSENMIQCITKNELTFFHASPTVFAILLESAQKYPNVPSMKGWACGSGNMPPARIRALYNWMPQAQFHTVFGMTETTGAGTIFPGGAAESPYIGSSGIPMPDLEVKILGDGDQELPDGEVGEIILKGSFLLERYYKMDSPDIMPGGWVRTGDLGYLNEAGYLYVVDRKKDMINRGGEKICSFDVENELTQIPGILEAAVVGIPDVKYIEVPVAMIVKEKGATITEDEIKDILKDRLAKYKRPVSYYFVDDVPHTATGKVSKKDIRAEICRIRGIEV